MSEPYRLASRYSTRMEYLVIYHGTPLTISTLCKRYYHLQDTGNEACLNNCEAYFIHVHVPLGPFSLLREAVCHIMRRISS